MLILLNQMRYLRYLTKNGADEIVNFYSITVPEDTPGVTPDDLLLGDIIALLDGNEAVNYHFVLDNGRLDGTDGGFSSLSVPHPDPNKPNEISLRLLRTSDVVLDYETAPQHILRLQAEFDDASADVWVVINVTDVDEPAPVPRQVTASATHDGAGTVTISPDGTTWSYTLNNPLSNTSYQWREYFDLTITNPDGTTTTQNVELLVWRPDLNSDNHRYSLDRGVTTTDFPTYNTPITGSTGVSAISTAITDTTPPRDFAQVVAHDPDTDAVVYSIIGGNEDGYFTIDKYSGAVRIRDASIGAHHPGKVRLLVQAEDASGARITSTLNITLKGTIAETTGAVSDVARLVFTIDKSDDAVAAISAVRDAAGTVLTVHDFEMIDGAVRLKANAILHHETNAQYTFTIALTENGRMTEQDFIVSVADTAGRVVHGEGEFGGDVGANTIFGGAGEDTIHGGAGADIIHGRAENDIIKGGVGDDVLYGGAGHDDLDGGAGDDNIYGGAGVDTLYGGADNDILYGGDDQDTIRGGSGNDIIFGGADRDTIEGGAGFDILVGGAGNDRMEGGAGADWFYMVNSLG